MIVSANKIMSRQESSRKRRSKWDVPGDRQSQSSNNDNKVEQRNSFAADATQKARERAAQLAAKLAAEGKLANATPPPIVIPPVNINPSFVPNSGANAAKAQAVPTDPEITKLESGGYMADLEINDLPSRVNLTKKALQDRISQQSGAAIATKGRFMQPEEKNSLMTSGEKPLYLNIQAPIQAKVQVALHMIKDVIRNFGKPEGAGKLFNGAQNAALSYIQGKVFVGLENSPPDYNVKEKLEGPNGSFFQHIVVQTGAKVHLKGKGSGYVEPSSGRESFEPLHIYVNHPNQEGLDHAKSLCENLVQSVHNDLKNWNQAKRLQTPFSQDYNQPISSGRGLQPVSYPGLNRLPQNYSANHQQSSAPSSYSQPQHGGHYAPVNYPPPHYPPQQPPSSYPSSYQGNSPYPAPRQDTPLGYPPQAVSGSPQSFSQHERGEHPSAVPSSVYPHLQSNYSSSPTRSQESNPESSTQNRSERKRRRFTEAPELIRKSTDTSKAEESPSHSLDSNTKFRSTGEDIRETSHNHSRQKANESKDFPPGFSSSSKNLSKGSGESFKAPSLPLSSISKKKKKSTGRTSESINPLSSLIPYSADSDSDSD